MPISVTFLFRNSCVASVAEVLLLFPRGKFSVRKIVEFSLGITVVSKQLLFIGIYILMRK